MTRTAQTTTERRADRGFRQLFEDRRGATSILVGSGMFAFLALSALAIDMGQLYGLRGQMQIGADAAALAAVSQIPDESAGRTEAQTFATANLPTATHGSVLANGDVVFGNWDKSTKTFTAGATPVNAGRVVLRRTAATNNAANTYFARIFGLESVDVVTAAVAIPGGSAPCLLALDSSEKDAVKVNNGTVNANGCALHANSTSSSALDVASGGVVNTEATCVVGNYSSSGTTTPTPETGCEVIPDPLAGMIPTPAVGPCDHSFLEIKGGTHTLSPGVYCGGLAVSGNSDVTMEPGTYIFKDGKFKISGGSTNVNGAGVTLFFTGTDAVMDTSGKGDVNLSAPTSGTYAGVLAFEDPGQDPALKHGVSGESSMAYEGTLYFPNTLFEVTGNGTGSSAAAYTVVIARLLKFSGNGELTFNYDVNGSVPLPDALSGFAALARARLVQ